MVFLVDDDPSIRRSLSRLLRSAGYEVRSFANGAEFLDALDAPGAPVDCVILDVRMPGTRGPELQAVISRRAPSVPVIILTATDDADLRDMASAAGVANVLRKPCDSEILLGAVAAAIGETPAPSPPFAGPPAHTTTPSEEIGCESTGLNDPDNFVVEAGRAWYRPAGSVSFDEAVTLVRKGIEAARRYRARELLVNTTGWTGFLSPDTFERFVAAVTWAKESGASLRLAVVARAEMIHPQKFGVLVAANRGLVSNIFTTELEARAWLDAPDTH